MYAVVVAVEILIVLEVIKEILTIRSMGGFSLCSGYAVARGNTGEVVINC